MIKVIIMIPSALTERWQGMFCIDALASQFDLEYWDCSKICKPAFEASSALKRDYAREIVDFEDMEKQLKRLPIDAVIFSHIHLEGFNYKLHQLISSYNRNRVYIDFWANRISSFLEATQQNNILQVSKKDSRFEKIIEKIPFLYYCVKYIEYGGGKEFKTFWDEKRKLKRYYRAVPLYNRYLISVKPHMKYSINHPDYEKYLSIVRSNEKPMVDGRYMVFLDQCFPKHPSLKTENPGVDFGALEGPYYNSLNGFFDKVEKQYDCKVVIAGHPIANYEDNPFDGRDVFYFKTAELVSNSIAVIMHCSFSISFPILFNKPVCIIANDAILHATEISNNLNRFNLAFKKDIVDTDNVQDVANLFAPIDETIRNEYINAFFDTSVEEKNKELLAKHINSIHESIITKLA